MEKHEEALYKALPVEIKELLLVECCNNSRNDMVSLICTDKSFYEAKKVIAVVIPILFLTLTIFKNSFDYYNIDVILLAVNNVYLDHIMEKILLCTVRAPR